MTYDLNSLMESDLQGLSIRIIDLLTTVWPYSPSHITLATCLNTIHLKGISHILNSKISVLYTIGYVQDPLLQFASPTGLTEYLPLWKSYFSTALEMIYFHYQDYAYAMSVSAKLDTKIKDDAYKVSKNGNYGAIVALSARQAIGGIVLAESAPGRIVNGEGE